MVTTTSQKRVKWEHGFVFSLCYTFEVNKHQFKQFPGKKSILTVFDKTALQIWFSVSVNWIY